MTELALPLRELERMLQIPVNVTHHTAAEFSGKRRQESHFLQTILQGRKIRAHSTSKREFDDLRAVTEGDLADAAVGGLSADRHFATAYNAALRAAAMAVAGAGYRTSGMGHHQTTFEAA